MKKIYVLIFVSCLIFSTTGVTALQINKTNEKTGNKNSQSMGGDDIIPLALEQLTENLLLGYIEDLVDISMSHSKSRFTGTAGCIEGKDYIVTEFNSIGLDVNIHNWKARGTYFPYNLMTFDSQNIIATLPGNPNSDKVFVVSAHYDTVVGTPSADDNSAGVAAVLIIAKILSQYQFNHEIRFICWSGEEEGLIGSNAYVKDSYDDCDNIIAAINLDMIGYQSPDITGDENKVRVYETCSDDLTNVVIDVSQHPEYSPFINLEVISENDDTGHGSDQRSFCKYAYDSIFIHEYTWNENKDENSDTIENMDVEYATRVARIAMATLIEYARSPYVTNNPPENPGIPEGPDTGKLFIEHTYTTISTDIDGDMVYYLFDWGDGSHSNWVGPYNSGESAQASHTWTQSGNYRVKVKSKDIHGIQSGWSEGFTTSQPRNRVFDLSLILKSFFEKFF